MNISNWIIPGKRVWIWHKISCTFKIAVIIQRNETNKSVKCKIQNESQTIVINFNEVYEYENNNIETYSDMCKMNILNEPEILNNLSKRHERNIIFTKIGETLIVINPYKQIHSLFQEKVLVELTQKLIQNNRLDLLQPHIYLLAGSAYQRLKTTGQKQAIIISGESGAGKTQNAKYCMKFLANLSSSQTKNMKSVKTSIQKRILDCNPVLQAFGNAKTIRNSNSSRFGKFVKLLIDSQYKIVGAKMQNYLLEKSRITSVAKKERSFHIFYTLLGNPNVFVNFGLKEKQKYDILQQSGCYLAENITDKENYHIINESLLEIGFLMEQIKSIWRSIATILMLSNLKFDGKANSQNSNNQCTFVDNDLAKRISINLNLDIKQLQNLLLVQKKVSGKETFYIKLNQIQCISNRNTFSKALYNRLFDFLILKMNIRLGDTQNRAVNSIGLLDIFGFQKFQTNSFQQLCINFTNQKLQKLYTKYIFDAQIEEISKDGLGHIVQNISPPDNKSVLQLIQKRVGTISIFGIIDDKTSLGSANDETIINQIKKLNHPNLSYNKNATFKMFFSIQHTQSTVTYTVNQFKSKNQDSITIQITQILKMIFTLSDQNQQKGKTLVTKFDKQIRTLMEQLQQSDIHFIRCIKPNDQRKPNYINQQYTLEQIKYLGILQTIKIRKNTFPYRKTYGQFNSICIRLLIQKDLHLNKLSQKEITCEILKILFPGLQKQKNSYLLGKQRVYLNNQTEFKLNQLILQQYKLRQGKAKKIQKQFKAFIFRKKILKNLQKLILKNKLIKNLLEKKLHFIYKHFFMQLKANYIQKELYKKQINIICETIYNSMIQRYMILLIQDEVDCMNPINNEVENRIRQMKVEDEKKLKIVLEKNKQRMNQKSMKNLTSTIISEQKVNSKILLAKKQVLSLKQKMFQQCYNNKLNSIFDRFLIFKSYQKIKNYEHDLTSCQLQHNPLYIQYLRADNVANQQQIIKGQLKIQKYINTKDTQILIDILDENYQNNMCQEDYCPISRDCKFIFYDITQKHLNKIISFKYLNFFEEQLRKRKNMFGVKKTCQQILTSKKSSISQSLIQLSEQQNQKALQVFQYLLIICQEQKMDKVLTLIEQIIKKVLMSSQKFKNEVLIQILKQQISNKSFAIIRMYQVLSIFLHVFTPDVDFLYACLNLFYSRLSEIKIENNRRQKQYIYYLFPRILRTIKYHKMFSKSSMEIPSKYQMIALMCRTQISLSIFFSIGNSVIIRVESYKTFNDIKDDFFKEVGINSKRLKKQFFGFFQIVNFQNQQIKEIPIDEDSNVWDFLAKQEKYKESFVEKNASPPVIILMIKIKYIYQLNEDDEESINLYYAQCYYDIFIGKLKIKADDLIKICAILHLIKRQKRILDTSFIPIWSAQQYGAQKLLPQIKQKILQIKPLNYSKLYLKFMIIKICSVNQLYMSLSIPVNQPISLYLKPNKIMLVQKSMILQEILLIKMQRWSNDEQMLMITCQKQQSNRLVTLVINTSYGKIVTKYLNECVQLFKTNLSK